MQNMIYMSYPSILQERPIYCGTKVNDSMRWTTAPYDHKQDAQLLLKRLDAQMGGEVEEEFEYKPMPDEFLNLDKGAGYVVVLVMAY